MSITIEKDADEEESRLWLTIKNISVHIIETDEGVIVDIYPLNHEDEDPITTTYAFFNEAEEE